MCQWYITGVFYMKKISFLVVAAFVATLAMMMFTSCSKEKQIEGKWKITKASGYFSDDKGETWTFKANGKCSCYLDGLDLDGEWSISKDELTIEINEEGLKITGDFTLDNLSSKEMSISGTWKVKYDDGDSGSWKVSYDFEKK